MAKKLAIRALQRGVGSMEFIDMLLIMEDPDESSDETPQLQVLHLQISPHPLLQVQLFQDQLLQWKIHQSLFRNGANVVNVEQCHKKLKTSVVIKGHAFHCVEDFKNCVWTQNTFSLVLETLMTFGMIVMIIAVGLFEKQPIAIL